MQKLIDAEAAANHTASFELQPWDWEFYSEKLRTARFDFDQAQVKPYFELEHVLRDGVFYAAQELYGLTFKERHDLPVYHPDVRVFEVFDADGAPLALFLGDFFARDNKQGGAWMNNFVRQSKLFGSEAGGGQQHQHSQAAARPADAADLRGSDHAVPRVRPRHSRDPVQRELRHALGHGAAAGLRRVSLPVQ